jgi:c-di-GMP-binding flagellar brake protein YcgR
MSVEHRQHRRLDIRLSAEVSTPERSFTATTRNLSAGGCCLESHYPLAEGADVRVDLFVVHEGVEDERMPPLTTMGTVQWVAEQDRGEYSAGLRFVGMTPAQHKWLEHFLAKSMHDD